MKHYLIDRVTLYLQSAFWYLGFAFHNSFRDECTPDFNCCVDVGRKCFIRIPKYLVFEKPKRTGLSAQFHRLWTKAVGTKDYDKKEWNKFREDVYTYWGLDL